MNTEKAMELKQNEYVEPDLGTAAFLLVRGLRLLGLADIGQSERSHYAFRFADPNNTASQLTLDYLRGDNAPAKAIVDAEKTLKTLPYGSKNRTGAGNKNWKQLK